MEEGLNKRADQQKSEISPGEPGKLSDGPQKSLGERRIRPDVNTSGHGKLTAIKELAVALYDEINSIGNDSNGKISSDVARWKSLSMTSCEQTVHWAEGAIVGLSA